MTQPDHGQIAGYLAAHWGNDHFKRPGHYASVPDPERLRAETVFAVAQHDNGWWDWEATPNLSESNGLPLGLAEVLKDQQAGMNRWRLGLSRFEHAPYANLLISRHAYWLYAIRTLANPDPAFTHPLFWKGSPEKLYPGSREEPLKFIAELEQLQAQWMETLRAKPQRPVGLNRRTSGPTLSYLFFYRRLAPDAKIRSFLSRICDIEMAINAFYRFVVWFVRSAGTLADG